MRIKKKICGFTLIELIIVVSMMAIVMAIAIPSFQSTIQNNYSVSTSNQLVNSFNFARSEAIKRNLPVSVCATADGTFTSCGSAWTTGWIIFVDTAGNGVYNSGTDTILRTELLTGSNATITSSPSINVATYNGSGFAASSTTNVTFTVKATGCTGTSGRTIAISMTGRLLVTSVACP